MHKAPLNIKTVFCWTSSLRETNFSKMNTAITVPGLYIFQPLLSDTNFFGSISVNLAVQTDELADFPLCFCYLYFYCSPRYFPFRFQSFSQMAFKDAFTVLLLSLLILSAQGRRKSRKGKTKHEGQFSFHIVLY